MSERDKNYSGSEVEKKEQNLGDAETVLPVVTMNLDIKQVRRYYAENKPHTLPDIKDILIHVRRQYPDPRQRVILHTDISLPARDLSDVLIYIAGVNEKEAQSLQGIRNSGYCLIEITKERMKEEGYGIQSYVENFCWQSNISSCNLLIYGDDVDDMLEVWYYMQESRLTNCTAFFPRAVVKKLRIFNNGLDLAPYARELAKAVDRNGLTVPYILKMLDTIGEQIKAGKTVLQDFEESRSVYAKWLTLVLTQRHNLAPLYVGSYIAEYLNFHVAYPIDRLSMYERFRFVDRLPDGSKKGQTDMVGYIGKYHGFQCYFKIMKKIYPIPSVAFNLDTGKVITENLDQFTYDKLRIADWRGWFKESSKPFVGEPRKVSGGEAVQVGQSDRGVDERIRSVFLTMTEAVGENILMSLRNSILAMYNGQRYVLYYSQMLGLAGVAISEDFGSEPMVVSEENFHQLIDARIIASIQRTQNCATTTERNSEFTQLVTSLPQTLHTAIPLDLLMCCVLVGQSAVELSYYDRRLRCDKRILPVITHEDSFLSKQSSVFDKLDIVSVGRDRIAGPIISSFGSINPEYGYLTQIPVCTDSFKGWKLL